MRRRARQLGGNRWLAHAAVGSVACTAVACTLLVIGARHDRVNSLSAVLAGAAVVAGLLAPGESGGKLSISASFIVTVLAAGFLGPASAVAAALVSELAAAARVRTRPRIVLFVNLPASLVPAAVAGLVVVALTTRPTDTLGFYATITLAATVDFSLSFGIWTAIRRVVQPAAEQFGIATFIQSLPSAGLGVLLAVAGASIYIKVGLRGVVFALVAVFAFSYMAHLLDRARNRAQQYVSLSWGVLAGLLRALDQRDQRAARHAAGVSRFARDLAAAVGMSKEECELAHTAGLLHDIGHFALSDRVHERGRTLTEEDWTAIQRHPELGADMLRDLGMYGPVAEIVRAHHERVDGRGYPRGLPVEQIPEIAKIIAVAEVYDTLTASDTYRTKMSSFEALRELRRVAGSQLDARYVEVLADLLSGEGVDYRHADTADFDSELDMERRINEVGAGG